MSIVELVNNCAKEIASLTAQVKELERQRQEYWNTSVQTIAAWTAKCNALTAQVEALQKKNSEQEEWIIDHETFIEQLQRDLAEARNLADYYRRDGEDLRSYRKADETALAEAQTVLRAAGKELHTSLRRYWCDRIAAILALAPMVKAMKEGKDA